MDPTSYKNNLSQLLQELIGSPHEGATNISYFLIFLSLFFFFLLSLKLLLPSKNTNKSLPPSPPKLPIIGNLHQLGSLPHRSVTHLSQKYGPLILLKLGPTPTLVVSSAKLAEKVMKSHDKIFSNRAQNTAAKSLLYNCHNIAFGSYGEKWKQAKKVSVLHLLSVKRVESFQDVRYEEVGLLVERIRSSCDDRELVNLCELLISTSNNIASRCVLGEKFEGGNGKNRSFGDVTRKLLVLLTAFCVGDAFPWLWWVDVLRGFHGELKSTFRTLDGLFDKVVEEHRVKMKTRSGDGADEKKDFVDILLQLQQDDSLDYRLSTDELKAILLDMFVGATDTTATSLEWTMAELMRNPTVMKKVQEEVRAIVGNKPKIETKDIQKMKYMSCVLKETLRLHPPVPLLLPRETLGNVNLEGYEIPPKTNVWINVWAIQRDPKIWKSPNEFIPERFMEENAFDFKGQDFEFLPFGSGRRMCVGISFGVASLECVLANLLHWFDWKLPEEFLDMREEHGLSVFKKLPLNVIPIIPTFV